MNYWRFGGLLILPILLSGVSPVSALDGASVIPEFKISVPVSMLSESGFTQSIIQPVVSGRFSEPNFYFRVKEKADASKGWGDADNLVSVLVQRVKDETWVFNQGQDQLMDLGGRYQFNTGTSGYFISVTGPDIQKVSTLAKKIKVLY